MRTLFSSDPMQIGWYVYPQHVGLAASALCVLLTTVSVWLVFGVRTRVVALLGLALFIGLEVVHPGLNATSPDALMNSAYVALLGLPLVLFGGGRFSMIQAGWREVL